MAKTPNWSLAHLYADAIQSWLVSELDSWLLREDTVQLETLKLHNIRLLDDNTQCYYKHHKFPEPKAFSLTFDGNDNKSGSEVF